MSDKTTESADALEGPQAEPSSPTYVLRLYVAGIKPATTRVIDNIKTVCETHLQSHYELEVIDLYERPYLASGEQIIATPTLIKRLPLPLRRIIGDMSDTQKLLVGLDLQEK